MAEISELRVAVADALAAERSLVDGQLSVLIAENTELSGKLADALQRLQELENPQEPAPVGKFVKGVYRSGNNKDLADWANGWELSAQTLYFSWWQFPNVSLIESILKNGRDVFIALDTKNQGGGSFTAFSVVAGGGIDTFLKQWKASLSTLLAKYPDRDIYIAIAHEAEIPKRNPADDATSFKEMTDRFSRIMRADDSGIKINYWAASGTKVDFYGDAKDFDFTSADRYKKGDHPVSETMTGTFQPFISTLEKVGNGWEKLPRGITETGIVVPKFSSVDQINWWRTARQAVSDHNLSLLVSFMSDRDLDYVPTDPAVKAVMQEVYSQLS